MIRIRTLLCLFVALALTLVACGEGDGDTGSAAESETTETPAAAEEAEEDMPEDEDMPEEEDMPEDEGTEEPEEKEPVETNDGERADGLTEDEVSAILAAKALESFSNGQQGAVEFTPEEELCIGASVVSEDPSLITEENFDNLTVEQMTIAFEALIDCAPEATRAEFLSGFDESAGFEGLPIEGDIGGCIYDGLAVDDDERSLRVAAFMAVGIEQPAPEESVEPGAALMAECINIADMMSGLLGEDPTVAEAIDVDCISTTFSPENTQSLFEGMLRDPAAIDGDDVPEGFEDIFNCFSFGNVFATQFAQLGVELSDAEVTCLDDAFSGPDAIAAFSGEGGGEDDLMTAAFGCFSADTMAALGA